MRRKFNIQCFETEELAHPGNVDDPSDIIELSEAIDRLKSTDEIYARLQLDENNVIVTKLSIVLTWAKRERYGEITNYVRTSFGYYVDEQKALDELGSAIVFDLYNRCYYYNDNFDQFLLTRKRPNVSPEDIANETYPAANDNDLSALHKWLNTLEPINNYKHNIPVINVAQAKSAVPVSFIEESIIRDPINTNESNIPPTHLAKGKLIDNAPVRHTKKSIIFHIMNDDSKIIFTFDEYQEEEWVGLDTLKELFEDLGYSKVGEKIYFVSQGLRIEHLHDRKVTPIENLNVNGKINENKENCIHVLGMIRKNKRAPEKYSSAYGKMIVKEKREALNNDAINAEEEQWKQIRPSGSGHRKILCYSLWGTLLVAGLATPMMIGLKNMQWKFNIGFDTKNERLFTISLAIAAGIVVIAISAGLTYAIVRCCNGSKNAESSESQPISSPPRQ
jgi:hypothetical protein